MVDYPLQGAAVAYLVFVDFGWDAGEGEEVVVTERGFVFTELRLFYAPVEFADFFAVEFLFGLLLVVDVDVHAAPGRCGRIRRRLGRKGCGEFAFEVGG